MATKTERLSMYHGMSFVEIAAQTGFVINNNDKGRFARLTTRLFDAHGLPCNDCIVRTVRLDCMRSPKEAVSFPYFEYNTLAGECWGSSTLRNKYLTKPFLFVVYQYNSDFINDGDLFFDGVYQWTMPSRDLEEIVKHEWETAKQKVLQGNPKILRAREDGIIHVRPHGRDGDDTDRMPTGVDAVKQSFWLNKSYIQEILC